MAYQVAWTAKATEAVNTEVFRSYEMGRNPAAIEYAFNTWPNGSHKTHTLWANLEMGMNGS